MRKSIFFTGIVCCLIFSNIAMAAQKSLINPTTIDPIAIPLNIKYLTKGPVFKEDSVLRVSIVMEEIYPSIYIEAISRGSEEGEPDKVKKYYFLSSFDIAKKIDIKAGFLIGLKFLKWEKWNEFILKSEKKKFKLKYNSKHQFEIEVMKNKQ